MTQFSRGQLWSSYGGKYLTTRPEIYEIVAVDNRIEASLYVRASNGIMTINYNPNEFVELVRERGLTLLDKDQDVGA